jgi:catalase
MAMGLPYGPGWETRNPVAFTGSEAEKLVNSVRIEAGRSGEEWDHCRPVHTVGAVATGAFTPTGALAEYTDAPHLVDGPSPATTRFSSFKKLDHGGKDLRGMATRLRAPDGWEHDLVALSAPRFLVRRTEDFHLLCREPGPKTLALMWFTRRVTVAGLAALTWHTKLRPRRGLAATDFFGVHTFWLVKGEERVPFRYRWRPVSNARKPRSGDLHDDLERRLGEGDVRFELQCQLLGADAPLRLLHDPMRPWSTRAGTTLTAGTLTLTEWAAAHPAESTWSFNPLRMPPGVEPSEDEILLARGGAYEASHVHRRSSPAGQPCPPVRGVPSPDRGA